MSEQKCNIFYFSGAKTLTEIVKLNQLYRKSTNFQKFYIEAIKITGVTDKFKLKAEYQTAILVDEAAENYKRLTKKIKLFPYWKYESVSDKHNNLKGIILPANDPLWDKIFPPNGLRCSCYVVPRMAHEVKDIDFDQMRNRVKEYFKTPEWKKYEAQKFRRNLKYYSAVKSSNSQEKS